MIRAKESRGETYETTDLYLAAYLRARDLRLIHAEKRDGRIYFEFNSAEAAEDASFDYYNNAQVGISVYTKAMQDLKNIIFGINRREYT